MSRIMSRLVAMAWLLVAMDANLEERVATLEAEIGSLSNELQAKREELADGADGWIHMGRMDPLGIVCVRFASP